MTTPQNANAQIMKKSDIRSNIESRNPPNAETFLKCLATAPSRRSRQFPKNITNARTYQWHIIKTKKSTGGILPMIVKIFGLTSEKYTSKGLIFLSTRYFFLLNMTDKKQYAIDLHTHSILSYDGGIKPQEYESAIQKGIIDIVAITDHNQIAQALRLQDILGKRIIIGEEIMTSDGEVIGLFLSKNIKAGLSFMETIDLIHNQNGLVYIPHPFDVYRHGIKREVLQKTIQSVDIIEVFNGRAHYFGNADSQNFVYKTKCATTSSSDAHSLGGLGSAYTLISSIPTKDTLSDLLRHGLMQKKYPPLWTRLAPKVNTLKKLLMPTHE